MFFISWQRCRVTGYISRITAADVTSWTQPEGHKCRVNDITKVKQRPHVPSYPAFSCREKPHQLSCYLLSALANFKAVWVDAETSQTKSMVPCFQTGELLPPLQGKIGDLLPGKSVCERNMSPLSAAGGSKTLMESLILAACFLLSESDLHLSVESCSWGLNTVCSHIENTIICHLTNACLTANMVFSWYKYLSSHRSFTTGVRTSPSCKVLALGMPTDSYVFNMMFK